MILYKNAVFSVFNTLSIDFLVIQNRIELFQLERTYKEDLVQKPDHFRVTKSQSRLLRDCPNAS